MGIKMLKLSIRASALVTCVAIVSACGGGDSSTGTPFSDPALKDAGDSVNYKLTGTEYINLGPGNEVIEFALIGSYSIALSTKATIDGKLVQPLSVTLSIETVDSLAPPDIASRDEYYDEDGNLVFVDGGNVLCYPEPMFRDTPKFVAVGDYGLLGDIECDGGSRSTRSWLVEASELDSSWLVIREFEDSGGFIIETGRHVDADGNTMEFEIHIPKPGSSNPPIVLTTY
jgi:hypothetical protein